MHRETFDQAVRELPRRGFLGLVGGLSGLLLGVPAVDARRRKRKKCKKGTTKCGKKCFNLQADRANCGACGVACPAGQVCNRGLCGCPEGQSLISGACIPRFGCTKDLDSCTFGKKACPEFTNESDARCYASAEGEPFCGTTFTCEAILANGICPNVGTEVRSFIPCAVCSGPGETGACVRPIFAVRS